MSIPDRKAELERKKAKLAALREERLRKEEIQLKSSLQSVGFPRNECTYVDGILREIGVIDNIGVNGKSNDENLIRSVSTVTLDSNPDIAKKRSPKLSLAGIMQCSIDSKEVISYSKEVQTEQLASPTIDRWNDDASRTFAGLQSFEWDDEIGVNPYAEMDAHLPEVSKFIEGLDLSKSVRFNHPDSANKNAQIRELTEEEKQATMECERFQKFFFRTARIVQRALDEPDDIFFDYSGAERENDAEGKRQQVKYVGDFFDKFYVPNGGQCSIVALDWSTIHPELLLAAYQSREGSIGLAASGNGNVSIESSCCCLWNLKHRQIAPEYTFIYQVDITAAILTEFHPSTVIGGTKGGQILLWDIRSNRRTPVQKTHLAGSGAAHVEAICGLGVTGSRSANQLVSVSSEGRMCSWSLDMLGAPVETIDLGPPSVATGNMTSGGGIKRSSNPITPTCLAFLPGVDSSRFLIGSQDGTVYAGSRNVKNAGLTDSFEGHKAPVTGVAVLANAETAGLSSSLDEGSLAIGGEYPLFVTTGMDCSVRLWSARDSPAYALLSFEDRNDYFVGCDASPIHPALFATTDLSGCLDLWSLNNDHEVPTASIQIEGDALLNRCRFHKKGHHLAVGGDDGRIRLFELNENFATPKADEWVELKRLAKRLSTTAKEEFDVQNQNRKLSHMR
nr:Dynein intermediate chain [Hymenolepis microstoma]